MKTLAEVSSQLAALQSASAPSAKPHAFPTRVPLQRPPGLSGLVQTDLLSVLDPAVVQSARMAGVPEAHLVEMARLTSLNKGRLSEGAKPAKPRVMRAGPLDESGDEAEVDVEVPVAPEPADQVAFATHKLTAIAESLTASKRKPETLEALLDEPASGSAESGSVAATGGRRNAAALRVLKQSLRDRPKELADGILRRMAEAGSSVVPISARGWVESRARIQAYPSTVRYGSSVA